MTHIENGTNCRSSPAWPCLQPSAARPECQNSVEREKWEPKVPLYPPWRLGIALDRKGEMKPTLNISSFYLHLEPTL